MARILVIDDSPTVVIAVTNALKADGHEVAALECFVDLPRHLRDSPPDLIVLDLDMPALSGVGFGTFLLRYSQRHLPVLIHSSQSREELQAAARQIKAAGVLEKGTPPEEFRRVVAKLLREAREGGWTSSSS